MADPLKALAGWRAVEGAIESAVPLTVAGTGWYYAHKILSADASGRPYTDLELAILLGAAVALTAWAVSRQLFLFNRRRPILHVLFALGFSALAVAGMIPSVRGAFTDRCEALKGQVTEVKLFQDEQQTQRVCQVGGVPDNPYLPGTLVLPAWSGRVTVPLGLFLAFSAAVASLGLRDRRLWPTRSVSRLHEAYRLAPARGLETSLGKPAPKDGRIQACGNATLWGETCGQIYSAARVFEPGEWCLRCKQAYRKADRELTFTVVSLFSAEIDVLNGLERMDTINETPGKPMNVTPRRSNTPRWVTLGRVTLPDVISVAQALSIVHAQLASWTGGDDAVKQALDIAQKRASRICAWIWFGRYRDRLAHARPSPRAVFAVGPQRLKDLVPDSGEELVLQLDVGLLPVEMRVAFYQRTADGRALPPQNSKTDLWIPVAPQEAPPGGPGVWVDRIEGDALRSWLFLDALRDPMAPGIHPLPYLLPGDPAPDESQLAVAPGTLDLVLMPLNPDGSEPEPSPSPAASIAEWEWLGWEQIQLLRQMSLVRVKSGGAP